MTTLFDALTQFYRAILPFRADDAFDINAALVAVMDRQPTARQTTTFRPSGLRNSYDCDRKKTFRRVENIWTDKVRPADAGTALLRMRFGSALHDAIQQTLGMSGSLFGDWRCPHCNQIGYRQSVFPSELCANKVRVLTPNTELLETEAQDASCADQQRYLRLRGEPWWLYEELKVEDAQAGIRGAVDGVWLSPRGWYVLEMKTTGALKFEGLMRVPITDAKLPGASRSPYAGAEALVKGYASLPLSAHLTQGSIYAELLKTAAVEGRIALDASRFSGLLTVYCNRDTLTFKTYQHCNTQAIMAEAVASIQRMREAVAAAGVAAADDSVPLTTEELRQARSTIMRRISGVCSSRTDPRAVICPWQLVCFPYKDTNRNTVTYLPL